MNTITFSYKLDYKSYLKVCFRQLYKSWIVWFCYLCLFLLLTSAIFDNGLTSFDPTIAIIIVAIIIAVIHLRFYGRAKIRYKTTAMAGEETFWKMDENGIEKKSTSSFSTMGWNNVYKITNDKKWIFIFYNKSVCTGFPKNLLSETQLKEIKRKVFEIKNKRT